jgi:PAS domain S-box-containing protein
MTSDHRRRARGETSADVKAGEQLTLASATMTAPRLNAALMRTLSETVGCVLWTTPPDGVGGERSAWLAFTGQTDATAAGWGWLDAVHPDDRAQVRQTWSDALASRQSASRVIRVRRVDGIYRTMRAVGAPVYSETGEVREWLGACLDVTDHLDMQTEQRRLLDLERAARADAQAAEARLRAMLEVLPLGVTISDADGTLLMMNRALHLLWGEAAPLDVGIAGYANYKGWWPDTGERLAAEDWALARALRLRQPIIAEEVEIETFDGQRKTILNSAAPIYDEQDAVAGGVAVNIDITERKRLEDELAGRLSELEGVFSSITDALFVYDAEGRLIRMNAAAHEMIGLGGGDSFDADSYAVLLPERARHFNLRKADGTPMAEDDWVLRRILRGESIPSNAAVDMLLTRPTGGDTLVSFTGAPIRDKAGAIIGAVSVGRDVTERRRLEGKLREANERLGAASARLTQQASDLETMNRRMDQFLGMANHEMKTPLTTLSANLQLAARRLRRMARTGEASTASDATGAHTASREAAAALTLLDRAQSAVRRMTRLVNELLDVSRIQTGRLELHQEPCDLLSLARGVIAETRHMHPERPIQLEADIEHAPVLADPDRLSEVIDNYLSNAIKYSPDDSPIVITLALTEDGAARIAVRDEGQGIAPETQARIWNVFERLDSELTQRPTGINLGLGLHICKIIIALHGGQVGVESAIGSGSTFWFILPLSQPIT